MHSQIGNIAILTLLATLVTSFPLQQIVFFSTTQVFAQTPANQKAEADRLLQQGIQQAQTSQLEAALKSWQQALTIAENSSLDWQSSH